MERSKKLMKRIIIVRISTMTGAALLGFLFFATASSFIQCCDLSSAPWESLAMPPEQSSKICSVDRDGLYVQTVTDKVYSHSYPSSWNNFREESGWREANPQDIGDHDCQKEEAYISWPDPLGYTKNHHQFKIDHNGVVWMRNYIEDPIGEEIGKIITYSPFGLIGLIVGAILGRQLSNRYFFARERKTKQREGRRV